MFHPQWPNCLKCLNAHFRQASGLNYVILKIHLRRFDDPSGFDAVGTDDHLFCFAVIHGTNILQIGIESSFCFIMSMADIVANQRFFPTNFTHSWHNNFSFSKNASQLKQNLIHEYLSCVKCFLLFFIWFFHFFGQGFLTQGDILRSFFCGFKLRICWYNMLESI